MITIVIPAHNERKNLHELIGRISATMAGFLYEIIVVDDGSTDGSTLLLRHMKKKYSSLRPVFLPKHSGQTAALQTGFSAARGEVVVSMDADLQNLPEDIPRLLQKLAEGFDVVCGWRAKRCDYLAKRMPSYLSNGLIRLLTGCPVHDQGCTLRAYRREVLQAMHLHSQQHRFIPLIATLQGWRVAEVIVSHQKRLHGTTNYSAGRLLRGLADLTYSLITTKRIA